MDFNLYGDAAQAAKQCCSEMATGRARLSARRPAACGAVGPGAHAYQTVRAAFQLPYLASSASTVALRHLPSTDSSRLARARSAPVQQSMARSVRYRP
ncbi:hypothetical protein [Paraburkholderia phytofirmans]|uniref:Uncharacterized protein n=1 Tax=Paraburkholderia phytofirmans TaxID=261302 RepID=A0ABW9BFZ4_9BURK